MKKLNAISAGSLLIVFIFLTGCRGQQITPAALAARPAVQEAIESIDGSIIAHHVEVLASDAFEGRRPATFGEAQTLEYLSQELASYGLEPVFDEGFLQPFSLGAYDIEISGTVGPVALVQGENIAATPWPDATVAFVDAPVVFGGYGLVSEAHGRNDYEGIDLTGAVVFVLGEAHLAERLHQCQYTFFADVAAQDAAVGTRRARVCLAVVPGPVAGDHREGMGEAGPYGSFLPGFVAWVNNDNATLLAVAGEGGSRKTLTRGRPLVTLKPLVRPGFPIIERILRAISVR